MGVRLIAFDRPGYGASDRKFGRTVADAAADVAAIADSLGIERFAVLGRSGGGPHALACGALLPDRITRVAALVGLAPSGVGGLGWFDWCAGMAEQNVMEFAVARLGHHAVETRLEQAATQIRADPRSMLSRLLADLTGSDRIVLADIGIRQMLLSNYAEGLRLSAAGWIDDVLAFTSPWGFDPADIEVPTLLWHGSEDRFTPAGHGEWLGDRIPGAISIIDPGGSHFDAIDVLPQAIAWLAGAEQPD